MLLETQQIEICNSTNDQYMAVLTEEALEFLSLLHQKFNHQRVELLNQRKRKQKEIDSGILPNFSDTTKRSVNQSGILPRYPMICRIEE